MRNGATPACRASSRQSIQISCTKTTAVGAKVASVAVERSGVTSCRRASKTRLAATGRSQNAEIHGCRTVRESA
jgi:hypothetical protein